MNRPDVLRDLGDVRRYFVRNDVPIVYVCHMSYYLMGIDEWVRRFRYLNAIDCFDGHHPRVFCPRFDEPPPYDTLEQLVNFMLRRDDVRTAIRARGPGKAVFLMFDEETEALCAELDLELIFPSAAVRRDVGSKVSATRVAQAAGVPCVPNVLAPVRSFEELRERAGHLGPDLVIQTPYGDSGTTTFFVSTPEQWARCAKEVSVEREVKVMRRIRCRQAALEACVTRYGTVAGPLMTEIVGFPELTPWRGGWAGNEVAVDAFPPAIRREARDKAVRVGDELYRRGYRGYFEIDFLFDADAEALYLGEINARITGASAMTNLSAHCHADAPLFLFHLLEWSAADFAAVDLDALNRRWSDPHEIDDWSQLVMKRTEVGPFRVVSAPATGLYRLAPDGALAYRCMQTHRRTVDDADEAFFLRIAAPGDVIDEGWDLGILVMPGRLMTNDYDLTERARRWIAAIHAGFVGEPA